MHLAHVTERDRSIADASKRGVRRRRSRWGRVALATTLSALSAGALAGQAAAQPANPPSAANHYQFRTLDNRRDLTFNQLLGINKYGVIAGYFGSGAGATATSPAHPNKGYVLFPRYRQWDYLNQNFPHSVQTQVTGLNDRGVTVGFWSDSVKGGGMDANFGWVAFNGHHFRNVNFTPMQGLGTPAINQLLGVNDRDIAVGFATDADGNNHGYTYNIRTNEFNEITIPGSSSVTAAAINRWGDVAGSYANPADKMTDGFVLADGNLTTLAVPGATMTQALGINDSDEVVGVYQDGVDANNNPILHGFTWTPLHGFKTVDDPNGIGTTTINGVNDEGQLVGFYVDGNGNTDGMLATPHHHRF
ncbi:MAG: hypothetical protein JOZ98_13315 [Solirubrobacterales bacterium]|nr:hypothetical protein [Solirubrobacterales bacterium]MBV9800340.1 hypothetical protein [Solirubrobacterales bacterium]